LFPILGCSLLGAIWYNFFAATGEYFYHANVKTPKWLRYFVQTPELHSIHHEYDSHNYNFSDIPIWDRTFGTYKDTTAFTERCGFPKENERKIWSMLAFRDVYDDETDKWVRATDGLTAAALGVMSKEMNEALKTTIVKNFKNTPLGFLRIRKNLDILHFSDTETEAYLRKIISLTPLEDIEKKGKNHYFKCIKKNAILTVNSHSITIITAKQIDKK
jgi:hypothetical protein